MAKEKGQKIYIVTDGEGLVPTGRGYGQVYSTLDEARQEQGDDTEVAEAFVTRLVRVKCKTVAVESESESK